MNRCPPCHTCKHWTGHEAFAGARVESTLDILAARTGALVVVLHEPREEE